MSTPLRLGVAGLGTVGASVIEIIKRQENALASRCGRTVRVVAVSARDRSRDRGIDLSGYRWFDDPVEMARDAGIDCLVELMGGADGPARAAVDAAIAAGKHVVTANKAMLASHGLAQARAAEKAGVAAQEYGVKNVEVRVCGPGPGRESAVRALNAVGFKILSISDVTPVPHNGCRPPKRRRV
jgi:ribosomal protein S11